MVNVRRRKNESFEAFFRRFTRTLQRSGLPRRVRQVRFLTPTKSKTEQRKSAIVRTVRKKQFDYQRKIGKLDDRGPQGRSTGSRSR